jgi:hypothetical protein
MAGPSPAFNPIWPAGSTLYVLQHRDYAGSMKVRKLPAICGLALCLQAQRAGADETVSYICVEDRAVGWETRDNGETVIGKFKPSESKLIVKWHAQKWVSISSSERFLVLPKIDVTEAGETFSYQSADCDGLYKGQPFYPAQLRSKTDEICESSLTSKPRGSFGSPDLGYVFSPAISTKPRSMQYAYSQTAFFRHNAYLNMGSCSLVE